MRGILGLALLAGCVVGELEPPELDELEAAGSFDADAEWRTVSRHNDHRAAVHSAPKLDRVPCLNDVARDWARNMARNGVRHNPALGERIDGRCGTSWTLAGENICRADTSLACWQGFLASASHHSNIDLKAFRKIGVGAFRTGSGALYLSVVFKD